MAIETKCVGCGRKLRVDDQYAGKQARCPVCDAVNELPTLEDVAAAQAQRQASQSPAAQPAFTPAPPDETQGAPAADEEPAPPPPDNTPWWMSTPEGPNYGPITKDVLDTWVRQGRVDADCRLRRGEIGPWQSATVVYPALQPPLTRASGRAPAAHAGGTLTEADGVTPLRRGGQVYLMPGRGPLILVLGILGWFTCPVFAVMAWVMGTADLHEMREGRMDAAGIGATQAGRVLGMICSIFWLVALVVIMFLFLYVVSV